MPPVRTMRNILMELRKVCQHPYLSAPDLENLDQPDAQQRKQLIEGSGKLTFLKLLLPKLKERGHRVLLFSQFKIALDRIEDFLYGEGYRFLRLDGDVQQAQRQKSMDAFNAPDSEFFIFLLTTRAGGVGINLASADTVIVYDPDFNPHMDLQAIARSHRYGQNKKVLVFKLMTKNSVEEQIILNGKKKMVLDHLVVQQMGKENEEGEIDNMLLHGAAALYDTTNEEGISASDIRYTSKDVDELIDKVEADADIEAKALKEKNEAFANGEAGQEMQEVAKPKESMSFGFAKIWEADQNRLQEISDDVDERAEDTEAWQLVMENAERERLAALMMTGANGQRSKRQAVLVKLRYGPDGPRKTKNKTKGKKRKTAAESSDTEFALAADGGGSESDSTMSPGVDGSDDLFDHEGNPTVRGLAAGKKGLNKKEFKALQAVRQAAAKAVLDASGSTEGIPPGDLLMGQDGTIVHGSNGAGPSIPPPSKISNAQETLEERAARKARRKEEKYQKKLRAHEDKPHLIHAQLGEQRLQGGSQAPRPIIPRNLSSRQNHVPDVVDAARVVAGQHILQWMYHTLRELGFHEHLGIWAKMALPELPGHERFQFYKQLATMVDDELYHRGQLPYFDGAEQIDQVLPILMGGKPVIPDLSQPVDQSFPALSNEMRTYRTASSTAPRRYAQHLPSPHQSPQPAPRQIAAPAQPGPPLTIARPASRSSLAGQGDGDAWQSTCTFCQNPGHNIKECGQAPSISDLESIRDSLAQGSHAEAEMATSKLEHITPGLHGVTPAEALVEVERLLRLHAEGVSKRQIHLSEPFALTNNPHLNDRTTIQKTTTLVKNGTSVTPGSRDAAIVIDDEEDDTVTTEAKTSDQVGTSQRSCPYCGEVCKRTIRHCATVYHDGDDAQGRKGLKARIRELDGRRDKLEEATVGGKGDPVMRRERDSLTQVIEELFGCYQVWPK